MLEGLSRSFVPQADLIERLAQSMGLARRKSAVHAVMDVDLALAPGELLAIVGESGCGKSTLARMAAGILPPTSGRVLFEGTETSRLTGAARTRAKLAVQMVFQDPYGSLNARKRVGKIVSEAPRIHGLVSRAEVQRHLETVLRRCGLDPALAKRHPHQLSGGQRQRIGIARALAVAPRVLICDEAVAALDVSIQAQILNLLLDLRDQENLAIIFITHDISVVERVADRVAVMYLGRIVETGPAADVLAMPLHPYTEALEREVPRLSRRGRELTPLQGELPSPLAPPPGCAFHPRCPRAVQRCREERPPLRHLGPERLVACHLADASVSALPTTAFTQAKAPHQQGGTA
jgi:peptide/nickel transport system ATP-binding protein